MNRKLDIADNLLLVGVVAVVLFVGLGLFMAVVHTIIFAVKVLILVAVLAVGWRVVSAITGGAKRRELHR